MDSDELCKIEFIDLNGVEENEKIRIRNSLQNYDSSVELPWIREKKHSKAENQPDSPNPQQQQHFIIQPSPLPPPPSLFYNQQMVTYAAHPHPSNVIYYPSNVNVFPPPLGHSHPQRIFVTAQPTFTAATNPGFFTVQSNVEEMLQNGIGNDHTEMNGLCKKEEEEDETKNEEHKKVQLTEIKNEEGEMSTKEENEAENDDKPSKKEEKPLKKEDDKREKSVNFPANKSWASLFNSSSMTTEKQGNLEKMTENLQENFVVDKKLEENRPLCPIKHPRKAQQFIDPDCYRMAEFLQAYEIDAKCTNLFQPRGLLNQSNYCYINSILQALIACPPLANLLVGLSAAAPAAATNEKRKPTPMIDGMCRFVKEFKLLPPNQHSRNTKEKRAEKSTKKDANANVANTAHLANTDAPFEPYWIYKMLNGLKTDLIEGRQEDAEEFLGVLLNGLNDEMLELLKLVKNNEEEEIEIKTEIEEVGEKEWKVMGPKNKGSVTRRTDFDRTPISVIFGGLLRSRVHRTGDLSTENIQPFLTLQLNIEKVKTVREALDALVSKHQLEGVTSSKTNEQVEAYQQVLLDELPIILILHLKCFDYKQDGCTKIVKQLEFGVDLRIDQKLLSSKPQSQREKHYKLFAIIYHDGKEASKGHYVTDAFHVGLGCWLRYDDAAVKIVTEEAVLKPHGSRVPYLLFYRRADSILRK